MRTVRSVLAAVMCIITIFASINFAFADNPSKTQYKPTFVVKPILPPSQNDKTKGYFDVNVKPFQNLTLYVELTNTSDLDAVISATICNAYTKEEGGISYDPTYDTTRILDEAYLMTKYAKIQSNIQLPARAKIQVPVNISVPNLTNGLILGGVNFNEIPNKNNANQNVQTTDAGFSVKLATGFLVGINLNLPSKPNPAFKLGSAKFDANGLKFSIDMENNAPIIQKISGSYSILDIHGNVAGKGTYKNLSMAPMSRFSYKLNADPTQLGPGQYTVKMDSIQDSVGAVIATPAPQNVQINSDSAKKIQETAAANANPVVPTFANTSQGGSLWMWIIIILLVLLILLGILVLIWYLLSNKDFVVTEKEFGKTSVLYVRNKGSLKERDRHILALYSLAKKNKIKISGAISAIFHEKPTDINNVDYELCLPITLPEATAGDGQTSEKLPIRELDSAVCVYIRVRGSDELLKRAYKAVTNYINLYKCKVIAPPREVYVMRPLPGILGRLPAKITDIYVPIDKESVSDAEDEMWGK